MIFHENLSNSRYSLRSDCYFDEISQPPDNFLDLNDIILRLEEELSSPHVVSLVTDYNVMPVKNQTTPLSLKNIVF